MDCKWRYYVILLAQCDARLRWPFNEHFCYILDNGFLRNSSWCHLIISSSLSEVYVSEHENKNSRFVMNCACIKPRLGLCLAVLLCIKPRLCLCLAVLLCIKPRLGFSLAVLLSTKPRLGLSLEACNSTRTRVTYTSCGCIFQCLVTCHFFVSKQKETQPASSGFSFCPFVCIGFT